MARKESIQERVNPRRKAEGLNRIRRLFTTEDSEITERRGKKDRWLRDRVARFAFFLLRVLLSSVVKNVFRDES
jgi:hypothetical protein